MARLYARRWWGRIDLAPIVVALGLCGVWCGIEVTRARLKGIAMRPLAMILLVGSLASCGLGPGGAEPAPAQTTYRSAFGVARLVFNEDATTVQGLAAGGETIVLLDCSDKLVVCRTVPGGPVFIAIARGIQNADSWRAEGRDYVVRARSSAVGQAQIVFVEVTAPTDPTWKEAFTYEIGAGVTSITFNYDANSRLSETLLLASGEGILRTLN